MRAPNTRERNALKCLSHQEWEYAAQIYGAGTKTLETLIQRKWVEPFVSKNFTDGIHERYCITELGRIALETPPVERRLRRPPLKTVPSKITTPTKRF